VTITVVLQGLWVLIVGGTCLALAGWARRALRERLREAEWVRARQVAAVATVLEVQDTGTRVGGRRCLLLRVRVQPPVESPRFDCEVTAWRTRGWLPRPGFRYRIRYDPASPARAELGRRLPPARLAPLPAASSAGPSTAAAAPTSGGALPPWGSPDPEPTAGEGPEGERRSGAQ
jgi:hypothetical protein